MNETWNVIFVFAVYFHESDLYFCVLYLMLQAVAQV